MTRGNPWRKFPRFLGVGNNERKKYKVRSEAVGKSEWAYPYRISREGSGKGAGGEKALDSALRIRGKMCWRRRVMNADVEKGK